MKINKDLFYFGLVSSVICLILSVAFYFCDFIFLYNLFNNILAGTLVLIATSIFGYFYEKKKIIVRLQNYIIEISHKFKDIKYFYENIISYDEMCDDCKRNKLQKPTKAEYNAYLVNQEKEILKYVDSYIEICDFNYNEIWSIYDDLYFIFDFKKKRGHIKDLFFEYIYDLIHEMRKHVFLLKKVKENISYYSDAKKEVQVLQNIVFEISEDGNDLEKFENNSIITNVIRSLVNGKEIVVGNKVIYKLDNEIFKFTQKM